MNKKILLIGGGGHCKSVLDSLLELNEYAEIGIVDKKENLGKSVMGVPVVGCDDDLPALFRDGYRYAFVTLGSIGNPTLRIKLFNLLSEIGYEIPVDTWVKEGDVINHINHSFAVYETPGHSEGGTVLHSNGILFSGDTLFFESIGRTDLPLSNPSQIQDSLKRLFKLFNDNTIVYPGHSKPTTIGHEKQFNPFIKR